MSENNRMAFEKYEDCRLQQRYCMYLVVWKFFHEMLSCDFGVTCNSRVKVVQRRTSSPGDARIDTIICNKDLSRILIIITENMSSPNNLFKGDFSWITLITIYKKGPIVIPVTCIWMSFSKLIKIII